MPVCDNCNATFPGKMLIDGRVRHLYTRRYCLACSPFGAHNTGRLTEHQTVPERRVKNRAERRRQSGLRATKRRQNLKLRAVAHKGGACKVCGYHRCVAALEFHRRDPEQKAFSIAVGSMWKWKVLETELAKCDLLCANCHREAEDKATAQRQGQHLSERPIAQRRVEKRRREVALRAVALKGGCCEMCGYRGCVRALEFHHLDPQEKAFQVRSGNTPAWARIEAEMEKCLLLCANCHREVEVEAGAALLHENLMAASTCA